MAFLQSLQLRPVPTRDGSRSVNYALGLTATLQVMYVPQYWGDLRNALSTAMAGDGSRLLEWADLYNDRTNGTYDNQTDANIAINCLDRPDPDAQNASRSPAPRSPTTRLRPPFSARCSPGPTSPVPRGP